MPGQSLPVTFTVERLLEPAVRTKDRLKAIEESVAGGGTGVLCLHGLFVLGVASFESMVQDMVEYYLRMVPHKLPKIERRLTKEDLLGGNMLKRVIQETVEKWSYGSLGEMVGRLSETLSIAGPDQGLLDDLTEIKETRNLLLHSDLVVNERYRQNAGEKARTPGCSGKLSVEGAYWADSLDLFRKAVEEIHGQVMDKYGKYRRAGVWRRLWERLFTSPVMQFDDYWSVSEDGAKLEFKRRGENHSHLASSERMLLQVWMDNLWDGYLIEPPERIRLRSLDVKRKADVLFLLSVADELQQKPAEEDPLAF